MATRRYVANAVNRYQIDAYTIAGPVAGASTYTIVCNGKTFTYVAATAVAATEAAALIAAFAAQSNILELLDTTATNPSGGICTFTANEVGVPFTFTFGVSGGGTFAGSTTTTNSGQSVFDLADNWSGSISAADDLVIDKPDINILYRLDQLTTSLTSFTVAGTFNGELGLPFQNDADYPEYRPQFAVLVCPLVIIGLGDGSGPSRCYIRTNAGAATTVHVWKTGSSNDDYPACMLHHTSGGSNSFAKVRVVDGTVGIALLPDQVATCTLLEIGDDNTNPTVRGGVGCTVTNMNVSSGTVNLVTSPTGTTNIIGGATVTVDKGGAATLIEVIDGTLYLGGTVAFTVTDLTVGPDGTLDLSYGTGAVTFTNGIKVYNGYTIIDPLNRMASSTIIKPQQCRISDGTLTTSKGINWTKS